MGRLAIATTIAYLRWADSFMPASSDPPTPATSCAMTSSARRPSSDSVDTGRSVTTSGA